MRRLTPLLVLLVLLAPSWRAGTAEARARVDYDATAPAAPQVSLSARDGAVRLNVRAAADTVRLRISRFPGRKGARRSTLYSGRPAGLTDHRVRNGRRYRYVVTAIDQAGGASRSVVSVRPGPRLLTPGGGAGVTAPPRLGWTRVRGATYYNVQLFRGDRKLLSAWPSSTGLQLRARWRFVGHVRRLSPGRYRWYVWPGYGARAERRYGRLVGSRRFVVSAVPVPVPVPVPVAPPPSPEVVPDTQEQQQGDGEKQKGDRGKHKGHRGQHKRDRGGDDGASEAVPGGQEKEKGDHGKDKGDRRGKDGDDRGDRQRPHEPAPA